MTISHDHPLPELDDDDDGGYDLTVFLTVSLDRYPGGIVDAAMQPTPRDYCVETGRMDGRWHLRVSPWSGSLQGDDVRTGPPVVDLRDQHDGRDPLTALIGLLSG